MATIVDQTPAGHNPTNWEKFKDNLRHVGRHTVNFATSTENFEKFVKLANAIFKAIEYAFSVTAEAVKNCISVLSTTANAIGATAIFVRISELFRGRRGEPSFYEKANPDCTVAPWGFNIDFKRVGRAFLAVGQLFVASRFVLNLVGLAKYAAHFVGCIPGIGLLADLPIFISSIFSMISNSMTIKALNKRFAEGETVKVNGNVVHIRAERDKKLAKWQICEKLNEIEEQLINADASKIAELNKAKTNLLKELETKVSIKENDTLTVAQKVEKYLDISKDKIALVKAKVKLYSVAVTKTAVELGKAIVSIINDIAKCLLIGLGIALSIAALAGALCPFSTVGIFVALGLVAAITGVIKVVMEYDANRLKTKTTRAANEVHIQKQALVIKA